MEFFNRLLGRHVSFRARRPAHLWRRNHSREPRPRLSRLQSPQIRPFSCHRSRHGTFGTPLPSAPAPLVRSLRLAGNPHHRPHPHRPRHHQRPRPESSPPPPRPRRRSSLRSLPAARLAPLPVSASAPSAAKSTDQCQPVSRQWPKNSGPPLGPDQISVPSAWPLW